jgi:hypothetical protein
MRFGASRKTDLLSPEEREIVDRFERGAIDATEAGRLLIASVQRAAPQPEEERTATDAETNADPDETPEEAAARELVQRIAGEIDAELGR